MKGPRPARYENLTLVAKEAAMIKRFVEMESKGNDSIVNWATRTLLGAMDRKKALMTFFPNLMFVTVFEHGIVIYEKTTKLSYNVETKDRKIVCSGHRDKICEHALFAALHPEFRLR